VWRVVRKSCASFSSPRCGAKRYARNDRRVRAAPSTRIAAMRAGESRLALICRYISARFAEREEKTPDETGEMDDG
jgi:hypothetical protein